MLTGILPSSANPVVIHIGGWKKLSDKKVDKEEFNQKVSIFLIVKKKIL